MNYDIITTIIALLSAYLIILYYCDTTMDYKSSRIKSHCIVTGGYIIYCSICVMAIPTLNIISCLFFNFFIIYLGYKNSIRRTLIITIILAALVMFSDLIASLIINVKIDTSFPSSVSLIEDIIFTIISKLLYFVLVVIFQQISVKRDSVYNTPEPLWMIILPISTCGFLAMFNQFYGVLNEKTELFYIIISIMLILSNLIVYIVCEHLIDKNRKISYLQEMRQKQEIDFKSYQLIKEKYNDLKIMVHDFNKYCNSIEALLNKDQIEVLSLTHKLKNINKEFLLVEYTNNTALNILLSQKMKECNKEHIDFQLYVKDIDLSFIDELDVIAIFANLIDNAMESCKISLEKKIFLSINLLNDSYIVFRLENSADKEPIIDNERILSRKPNRERHGMGLISVKKSLSKYNAGIKWNYDDSIHVFATTILIQPAHLTEAAF